jgi:MoaA/NifB/PqqE/SkfB family radical SAM enzyme
MKLLESSTCPGSATFHPGSICNLACVTCGPGASTRWQHELGIPVVSKNVKEINQDLLDATQQMAGIVIGGGEPVLNFSTKTLLSSLRPDQTVSIHFNGTVLPDQNFLDASSNFQHIRYVFSIDGIGKRFDYLRWPAKWDRVVSNVVKLVQLVPDNVEFGVNITVSQLNRQYLSEILEWVNQTIPQNKQGKQTCVSYNQAGNMLTQQYLDSIDKKRNLNWKELFPLSADEIPD